MVVADYQTFEEILLYNYIISYNVIFFHILHVSFSLASNSKPNLIESTTFGPQKIHSLATILSNFSLVSRSNFSSSGFNVD